MYVFSLSLSFIPNLQIKLKSIICVINDELLLKIYQYCFRSIAIPIIPVRQRLTEVKTCPIDRPRSTTPINPAMLDDYASTHEDNSVLSSPGEKMQITLPR